MATHISLVAVDIAFRPAASPQRFATHRARGLEVANRSPRRSLPRRRAHLLRRLMVASSQAVDRGELSQHTLWRMSGWEAYGKPRGPGCRRNAWRNAMAKRLSARPSGSPGQKTPGWWGVPQTKLAAYLFDLPRPHSGGCWKVGVLAAGYLMESPAVTQGRPWAPGMRRQLSPAADIASDRLW